MPIYLSEEVADGLEACRQSGAHNMFDRNGVMQWLNINNYHAAVCWVADNKGLYSQLIFNGMEVETFDDLLVRLREDPEAYSTLGDLYEMWGPLTEEQRDRLMEESKHSW